MANGNGGSDWIGKIGNFVKTAGPWGVIVVLGVALVAPIVSGSTTDTFTHVEALELEKHIEEKIAALTDVVSTHIGTPHHYATAETIAELRTDQKHLLASLDRLDKATQRILDLADSMRLTLVEHETRLKAMEAPK